LDLRKIKGFDRGIHPGHAFEVAIVVIDEHAVFGSSQINFHIINANADGAVNGGHGVFGCVRVIAPVSDDGDGMAVIDVMLCQEELRKGKKKEKKLGAVHVSYIFFDVQN